MTTNSPIQSHLQELHDRYAGLAEGQVATYIPELARADPGWFGICVATTDGYVYEVGDTRQPFTIQSISKPLVYGIALEDRGRDHVLAKIGVEPTGDAFNSISLAPGTGCPLNPMINAGAIASTSLVAGRSDEDKLARILGVASLYAGRSLTIDEVVYQSEKSTGHRNRAIGHLLRNFDILTEEPNGSLDLYFQQCSILVDCRDLSLIGATLANGGTNPCTRERAVRPDVVDNILSVMTTCGMYDFAGEWVYRVGMPAKSGVGGGILAVLPGQLGVGVFSPPLDARGNSVRGVKVCEDLSNALHLHFLNSPRSSASVIRSTYTAASVRSKRRRTERESRVLDAVGSEVRTYELHGDLVFSTVEAVVRRIVAGSETFSSVIVDLSRVTRVDPAAGRMLLELLRSFEECDKKLVFTGLQAHRRFRRALDEAGTAIASGAVSFVDVDLALEWCETRLLAREGIEPESLAIGRLAEHGLCRGIAPADVAHLETLVEAEHFEKGELILRKGEAADKLYFLMSGEVSVQVELPEGRLKRLVTMSAGMGFGEQALVEGGVRSADIRADQVVECFTLSRDAFEGLGARHAALRAGLLLNLLQSVMRIATRLNDEVVAFEG